MNRPRKRLLVIGAGSSGLITLKTALEQCRDWDVICMEQSADVIGCWGNPYQGFVSTTTCYATQFASMVKFDAKMAPGDAKTFEQFFCDGDYGNYLRNFSERYQLGAHIRLRHQVLRCDRDKNITGWKVRFRDLSSTDQAADPQPAERLEIFDAIVVCTGLVSRPGKIEVDPRGSTLSVDRNLRDIDQRVSGQTVVVCGGGESAVDTASRLADESLGNRVYLSLRSGIRVSPRYHPIRRVPSDFLRNRLMLSIHPDIRNRLGDWFVKLRIRLERFSQATTARQSSRRRGWARRLHLAAGEDLFDMFHNKSDTFLDDVAAGRIRIIGPPLDSRWRSFRGLSHPERVHHISPNVIIPTVGFRSSLELLFGDGINLSQFYLACVHDQSDDLFAVGFARPVIGNIPSMSELQADWVCGILSGRQKRPSEIQRLNRLDREQIHNRYTTLGDRSDAVYPTEMFAYCDRLAKLTGRCPDRKRCGSLAAWLRLQLTPASTLAYFADSPEIKKHLRDTPIHLPWPLIGVLLLIKPIDWSYRLLRWVSPFGRTPGNH